MDDLKRAGKAMVNFMGIVVPNISFIMMFITSMISICSRYSFRSAVTWGYGVSVLGYIWTMFLNVGETIEADEHVVFGLIYDILKPFRQFTCKMVYNIFLLALPLFCFVPCVQALPSRQMVAGVLKPSYTAVFAPFVCMSAEVIVHAIINIVEAIKDYKQIKEGAV